MSNRNHGGKRENTGRKPGSVNTLTGMREQVLNDFPGFNPVSFLISVAQGGQMPINIKIQACHHAVKAMYPPEQLTDQHQNKITGFEVICEDDDDG